MNAKETVIKEYAEFLLALGKVKTLGDGYKRAIVKHCDYNEIAKTGSLFDVDFNEEVRLEGHGK